MSEAGLIERTGSPMSRIEEKPFSFTKGEHTLEFDKRNRFFCLDGKKEVYLAGQEHKLLVFLMSSPEHLFTRTACYEMLYSPQIAIQRAETKTVAIFVHRLRQKLECFRENLVTAHGQGYLWRA